MTRKEEVVAGGLETAVWGVVAVLMISRGLVVVVRDVIAFQRYKVRRQSLERLVTATRLMIRISDRDADGGVLEIYPVDRLNDVISAGAINPENLGKIALVRPTDREPYSDVQC